MTDKEIYETLMDKILIKADIFLDKDLSEDYLIYVDDVEEVLAEFFNVNDSGL